MRCEKNVSNHATWVAYKHGSKKRKKKWKQIEKMKIFEQKLNIWEKLHDIKENKKESEKGSSAHCINIQMGLFF